jgi:hypothetical protein
MLFERFPRRDVARVREFRERDPVRLELRPRPELLEDELLRRVD